MWRGSTWMCSAMRASRNIPTVNCSLFATAAGVLVNLPCTCSLPITWRWSVRATLRGRLPRPSTVRTRKNSPGSPTTPPTVQERSTNSASNSKNTPGQSPQRHSQVTPANERAFLLSHPLSILTPAQRPPRHTRHPPCPRHRMSPRHLPPFPLPPFLPQTRPRSRRLRLGDLCPCCQRRAYPLLPLSPPLTPFSSPHGAPTPTVMPSASIPT